MRNLIWLVTAASAVTVVHVSARGAFSSNRPLANRVGMSSEWKPFALGCLDDLAQVLEGRGAFGADGSDVSAVAVYRDEPVEFGFGSHKGHRFQLTPVFQIGTYAIRKAWIPAFAGMTHNLDYLI